MNTNNLKILILYQKQFGYHIDTYIYCKFLRYHHNITYICWDYSKPKQALKGINIIYISRSGNILIRNLRYLCAVISYLKHNITDICFIVYFRGCSMLKLIFPNKIFVFDIRSGYIKKNKISGLAYNSFLKFESLFFKNITVISNSLAKKLKINKKMILPLGSIPISNKTKNSDNMKLLYVGTLLNRDIDKTIQGVCLFLQRNPEMKNTLSYTIIGDSDHNELEQLKRMILDLNLSNNIKMLGRIPFDQLKPYFDTHNVGVSFVPQTPYFDVQPVTKTFDYLLSGIPVIGTSTSENKLVINENNGVLIDDSIESFAFGLDAICKKHQNFKSQQIIKKAHVYHWSFIVSNLEKYLLNLCKKEH